VVERRPYMLVAVALDSGCGLSPTLISPYLSAYYTLFSNNSIVKFNEEISFEQEIVL